MEILKDEGLDLLWKTETYSSWWIIQSLQPYDGRKHIDGDRREDGRMYIIYHLTKKHRSTPSFCHQPSLFSDHFLLSLVWKSLYVTEIDPPSTNIWRRIISWCWWYLLVPFVNNESHYRESSGMRYRILNIFEAPTNDYIVLQG